MKKFNWLAKEKKKKKFISLKSKVVTKLPEKLYFCPKISLAQNGLIRGQVIVFEKVFTNSYIELNS